MPLSKDQLKDIQDKLNEADKAMKATEQDIVMFKKAGIDVTEHESDLKQLKEQIRKMKSVFLPMR